MKTVEEFGVGVGVQADGTGELLLHYLQGILNSCEARSGRWELGSHCLGRKNTPCEDRSITAQSTGYIRLADVYLLAMQYTCTLHTVHA